MRNDSNKGNNSDRTPQPSDCALHVIFNTITYPVFMLDREGTILEANQAFARIFGKQVHECVNENVYTLLPPKLAIPRREKAEEAFRTAKPVVFEDERDGRFIRHSISPIADIYGKISRLYIISQDITEIKLAENESKKLQAFNGAIIEAIPGAFYMVNVAGHYVEWNAYQRDVVVGKPDCEMGNFNAIETIHPDHRQLVAEKMLNILQNDVEDSEEVKVLLHGGPEFRWFRISGKKILINGNPFVIGIGSDITERKQAEETALRNSENRFRMLFEGHSYIMVIIDDKGNIIDANPAAAAFYGWPISELCKMHIEEITTKSPENIKLDLEKYKTSQQSKFSSLHRRSDGSVRDVEVVSNTIEIEGNTVFYCIINDITERKTAEQALRSSEQKFRSITEQMSEMVFVANANGYVTYVSPAVERLFGYMPDEVIGHLFTEYMAKEEVTRAIAVFHDALLNNVTTQVLEFKYVKKDGSFFDGEVHVQYFRDDESSGMIGLIHDISDRKRHESIRRIYEHKLLESRQFLKSIYEEVNHSIFVVDVLADDVYRFRGNNPLHEKITGVSSEKISGKKPEEIFDPQVATGTISHFAECVKEAKTITYEESIQFKGKYSCWETVLNPVRNEAGHIYRIIGTSTNITERKLAENQLKKLSIAVEQSPVSVVVTDPAGDIEYVNLHFTGLTGYSTEEAIGKNPRILKSDLMPDSVYEDLWKTILSGEVWRGELQNKKKNGELYWETATISAILNNEGLITNFVAVKEDITEHKKILDELIKAKEKAEESDRLKTAFLANISHEIRTPMNGILGFSKLLKEHKLSGEKQAEYVDLIQQSGERMLSLINDLIDISRIAAGETLLHITETPVNKLLEDLYALFKKEAKEKGLNLNYTPGLPDSESIIETDSLKLKQICTNLIQNALKFTHKGDIDFGYVRKNNMLEFYVNDSGIGMPEDMKEMIFERFHQIDNSLTRHHEGPGLGLSISKSYIEMLGGTISVESKTGKGSKFAFTLPYTPPRLYKAELSSTSIQELAKFVPGLTIVVAEDDKVSNLVLTTHLKSDKTTIMSAFNGQEAVELVKLHPEIDFVLMDMKMPVMDGFEATRQIKKLRPELPIIAQTAFTSKEVRKKAMEAGCDSFITKPINKAALLELMLEILKR
ncbi:MAG: PAS domain S-box protein [Chlorobiales bacterium]|nr:PAS domain S-box protein [Chlorobiales bacterium]